MTTSSYLRRLGIDEPPPPTLESLFLLHRRHLANVPYENLGIMLGRPPSVDPSDCLERVCTLGRAGYCFHQNGALQTALVDLGFEVTRRHGHVWTNEEDRYAGSLNHLVLVVSGLATSDNPGGDWWVDVGLGDAFLDPIPLVAGEHRQGGFTYVLEDVGPDGWTFHHDPAGSFTGMVASTAPTDPRAVLAAHTELSTPPDGHFTRVLVAQRRDETGAHTLRCCLLIHTEPGSRTETELTTYDEWRAALTDDLRVPLDDVATDELHDLWLRMRKVHEAWDSAGRP